MITAVLLTILPLSSAFYSFADYKVKFNKSYSNDQSARETYYNNAVSSASNLVNANVGYTIAENQYWDQSPQQISKLTQSVKILSNPLNDNYADFKTGGNQQSLVPDITQINWVSDGKVTSVKSQESCGSAWAFSVAAMCQSAVLLKQQQSYNFSEQKLLSCTSESSCSGGYVEYAMETAINQGLPTEEAYPYLPNQVSSGICSNTQNIVYPGQSYYHFYNLNDEQILGLLKFGPLVTHLSAQNWIYYKSGTFQCSNNSPISHAALIVGVTKDYYIIKNSWGEGWGQNGYIKITRQSGKNCGIGSAIFVLSEIKERVFIIFLAIANLIIFMQY